MAMSWMGLMSIESRGPRTVVVTGGGRGIGAAIANELYDRGMIVCIAGPTLSRLESLASGRDRARILPWRLDVTSSEQVVALREHLTKRFGTIDFLVNSAGISPPMAPAHDTDPDIWWRTFEVNLRGTYLCSTLLLPLMRHRPPARVINLCSSLALGTERFTSSYTISKHAVLRLTEFMNFELAPDVLFFALNPGLVLTDMTRNLVRESSGQSCNSIFERIKSGRVVQADRVGRACYTIFIGEHDAQAGQLIDIRDLEP